MLGCYKFLYQGGSGELIEKKSRFVAVTRPVHSEEEALVFINEQKKQYWDARHHCYAYVLGAGGELCRCSDDGEPSQTAGRPMLDVLLGQAVRDVCVVVSRYFGGTLLGTGGLVRAYSGAVQEGLRNSVVLDKRLGRKLLIGTDYNGVGKIQYLLGQRGITTLNAEYTEQVALTVMIPVDEYEAVISELTDASGGRAVLEDAGTWYFVVREQEFLLFEQGE